MLRGAPPADEARLSRRTRHVALALDRDEDVAATMFLRRGVSGVPELDVHTLELTDDGWRVLGGGGGPGGEALRARPRLAALPAPGVSHGQGGTARTSGRRLGWRQADWVRWAQLRLARGVAVLHVGDRRLPVAQHGMAVVVWSQHPPAVTALDSRGVVVGTVPLGASAFPAAVYRDDE